MESVDDKPDELIKGEAQTEQLEEIIDGITASHGAHLGQIFGVIMH